MTRVILTIFMVLFCISTEAQLKFTPQVRTRTEWRNGVGTLALKGNSPSFFTSQRSRLAINYRSPRVNVQTSIQDVRVWGQDPSTISNADGAKLSAHEAWFELILFNRKDSSIPVGRLDQVSFKIGRQELIYDDSRLIGNLDWLQQGRRHDAALLKIADGSWVADLGIAFNQNTDAFNFNGTYYTPAMSAPYIKDSKGNLAITPAGMIPLASVTGISTKSGSPVLSYSPATNGLNQTYKSFQFLYLSKQIHSSKISALIFADQFSRYRMDSVKNIAGTDTGSIYGMRYDQKGTFARYTGGFNLTSNIGTKKNIQLNAQVFGQTGKNKSGTPLQAYAGFFSLSLTKKQFSYIAGWDILSGNDASSSSAEDNRFDPLYGTPHKFWGYMDYFYTGAPNPSPPGGLNNPYIRVRYHTVNKKIIAEASIHYFAFLKKQNDLNGEALNNHLGTEADLQAQFAWTKAVGIEVGLSAMKATHSMEYAKKLPPGSAKLFATWAYLQINIHPEILIR